MDLELLHSAVKYLGLIDARAVRLVSRSWRYVDLTTERQCSVVQCSERGARHTLVGPQSVEYDLEDPEPKLKVVLPKPVPLSLWPPRIAELEISTTFRSETLAGQLGQMVQCKHLDAFILQTQFDRDIVCHRRVIDISVFEQCASLRYLSLDGASITGSAVLPDLTDLSLRYCTIDSIVRLIGCGTVHR